MPQSASTYPHAEGSDTSDGALSPPIYSPGADSPTLSAASPSAFLALGEHVFTPISMDDSDCDPTDKDVTVASVTNSARNPLELTKSVNLNPSWRSTSPSRQSAEAQKQVSRAANGPSCTATAAPPTQTPPSDVQATLETLERYDLTAAKNIASQAWPTPDIPNSANTSSTVGLASSARETPFSNQTSQPVRSPILHEIDSVTSPRSHSTATSESNIGQSPRTTATVAATTATSTITGAQGAPIVPHVIANVTTIQPSVVRRISNASVTIRHPVPDLNPSTGAYRGNIAALEATAERFSMTSSIEDAIRDAHDELKRSDSRRSSFLRANSVRGHSIEQGERRRAGTDASSGSAPFPSLPLSRQSSIVGTNIAARQGGYSPAGYVMSPANSLSNHSNRLRSASKTSSVGHASAVIANMDSIAMSPDAGNRGEDFPFLSRHGPGKASMRSVMSGKLSLAEIAEIEPPTSLTGAALDEAERTAMSDDEEDERMRAQAHQYIEPQFMDEQDDMETPPAVMSRPILENAFDSHPSPKLQLHHPDDSMRYGPYDRNPELERPPTADSSATYEAQMAFGDFDGTHCEPEVDDMPAPLHEEPAMPTPRPRPEAPMARPTSYFDPSTGQQMLYYPARVPAMLNLPPKLSKRPGRASVQNFRRSQVLSAMPEASRASRVWLPDPLEGMGSRSSLSLDMPGDASSHGSSVRRIESHDGNMQPPETTNHQHSLDTTRVPEVDVGQPPAQAERALNRPQRLSTADRRQSRMANLGSLPPQLRASAFFDLPDESLQIEAKGGSAMATLDSILDASAAAPVSAFTDHAFAGRLGDEVYGPNEKKAKKKRASVDMLNSVEAPEPSPPLPSPGPRKLVKRNPSTEMLNVAASDPKKRASFLSLLGGGRSAKEQEQQGPIDVAVPLHPEEESEPGSPNQLEPDDDERDEEDDQEEDEYETEEESDEEQPAYQGPPTTLLAELQLRKQQQKLRTQPIAQAYPNGLHSTLLELDAVHEVERRARNKKKVNLAWEDPSHNPDAADDDDDDVPLAMLAVGGRQKSAMDVSAMMAEIHRPLGLMERRDLEENEPLSQRRQRLQGKKAGPAPVYLNDVQARMSNLALTPGNGSPGGLGLQNRSQSQLALPLSPSMVKMDSPGQKEAADGSDSEVEGETLAARKQRLAADNPLPRARPVSGTFSAELLSQFGEPEAPPASNEPVPEEEETLGQRRRRLQLEREAREREMGPSAGPGAADHNAMYARNFGPGPVAQPDMNRGARRLSMAGVLSAHPLEQPQGRMNPIDQERLRREAEAARFQRDQDVKMAMLRAQMPSDLRAPSFGAKNGGYMGGRFNDGLGGGVSAGTGASPGYRNVSGWPQQQPQQPMAMGGQYRGNYNPYGHVQPQAYAQPQFYGQPQAYTHYGMGAGMMPSPAQQTGQVERVENWRQSIMPS